MSGKGTQDDPCTTTIFQSIVHLHLLYSASSPVPDKVQYLIIVAWFYNSVYLNDEMFILLEPHTHKACVRLFLCFHMAPPSNAAVN
jgi:hypothetical protein